jgi:HAE1 family hydrophobic/amphiphilic exporter-1
MRLVDLALRRRVTIAMATVAITLFGVVSLSRLKVNLLPDLSYPTLTIRTELPGAAPLEVENLIARPVEEAAGTIRNVRSVRSVSRSGQADVVLEFAWGTDMDFAGIEVRERLDLLQLPVDARRPLLLRFDPSTEPVLRLAFVDLAAAGATHEERLKTLRRFADDRLKPALEATEGSAAVKVSGGFEDEVHVQVDQDRLSQLKLDVATIASRIGAENVNLSGGRLEQGTQRFLVRTLNEFRSLEEMENMVVATIDDHPVYLRDIARVERGYRDRTAITRLDGRECVELAIYKEGDANTVQLAQAVRTRVAELGKSLPADTKLQTVYDQSTFISNSVGEVSDAAIWGGLLSVIVLYLFLRDARATLVAGIVIPVTVIGIFVLMYGFNLTLNVMSLGGIALSVGMLIDNSVVILEAISRKRDAGLPAVQAAREGTAEVAMAVTASTLTTVAVFFPMVFVSGIAGQLFRDQALTVTFAQVLSLLVSLTLVPMMAAWRADAERYQPRDELRPELAARTAILAGRTRAIGRAFRPGDFGRAPAARGLRRAFAWLAWPLRLLVVTLVRLLRTAAGFIGALCGLLLAPAVHVTQRAFAWLDRLYPASLEWALRRRALVLAVAVMLLAASSFVLTRLPTELIPQLAQGEFNVKLRLPAGSPLDSTDRVLRAAQAAALTLPGLDQAYAVSGTGNRLDANPVDSGENIGEMSIRLKQPAGPREEAAAMAQLRRALDALPGVQYEFSRPALFTLSTPLEVVLSGYEIDRLQAAASLLRARMEASGAFTDLRSSIEGGHPEIQILFDQDRASRLGLEVRDVADGVVASLRGDVATRYQLRDRKIDVLVRSVDTRDASIEEVRNLAVNPGAERPVPLAAVADVRLAMGPAEIRRASQERVAVLSAAPAGGNLGAATAAARNLLADTELPAGITSDVTGQSEEMQQSFRSLMMAFALAVFLVYLVMASQFESLRHPFVILFTIPMGLIGAVWGLALTGTTVNAVAFIGLILLAGIVVNNAIVLLDAVNQARERGLARHDALVLAGRTRLRPILITSVSTILGLLPMAIGFGEGAEVRRPMAITVIGGMLVATVLTLIIIPVLYTLLDRREQPAPAAALAAPRA